VVKMGNGKTGLETFQDWFKSQTEYKTKKDFIKATGIPRSSLVFYLRGVRKPLEEHRKILYEVTGLECFKSELEISERKEEMEAVTIKEIDEDTELPLHILLQNWFESQTKYKTRKDFAKAAGIGYSNINKYFRGESQPSKDIREKLYEFTGIEIFGQKPEITKVKKDVEQLVELETPFDLQEKIKELQNLVSDLSEKVNSFEGLCEKCIASKLPNSTEESSVKERVEIVKELLYALNKELEFFKKTSPESREMFRKKIHAPDVGYIIALLRALFDEDKFQSWLYMTDYRMNRR